MAPKHRARKLLGATVGLASISLVGTACTSGNLVVDTGPPIDADQRDTGVEASDAGKATADTGSTEDTGQTESDSGT